MPRYKPNILLITCDQWRGDSLSAVGHPVVRTPNADALAAEGVLFRRHYGGAAPCAPARACLYTGLHQMTNRVCRNGTPLDGRHGNVARAFRVLGYDPTLFGYTDVGPDPRRHAPADPVLTSYEGVLDGFTVRQLLPEHHRPWLSWLAARGVDAGPGYPDIHRPADPALHGAIGNAPPAYAADETATAFLADEFLRWLGEQPRGDAWFAHISFISPHPPFIVPAPYNTMYDPADGPAFARAADRRAECAIHPYVGLELDRQKVSKFLPGVKGKVRKLSEREFRQIRATYWGMVSEVDAQLGRIWAGLREHGDWDDTIVVLTSDHAEMMGDHLMLGKGGFFDGSYHIPLIVRAPGARRSAGSVVERFTGAVDILPTLLDLAGGPAQPWLDGASLKPFIDGNAPKAWRDAAHWEFDFRTLGDDGAGGEFGLGPRDSNLAVIRTAVAKYVHFTGLPPVLFDLVEDPHETRNVAADPAYAALRLEMAERLLAWRSAHLDQSLALAALTGKGVRGPFAPRY